MSKVLVSKDVKVEDKPQLLVIASGQLYQSLVTMLSRTKFPNHNYLDFVRAASDPELLATALANLYPHRLLAAADIQLLGVALFHWLWLDSTVGQRTHAAHHALETCFHILFTHQPQLAMDLLRVSGGPDSSTIGSLLSSNSSDWLICDHNHWSKPTFGQFNTAAIAMSTTPYAIPFTRVAHCVHSMDAVQSMLIPSRDTKADNPSVELRGCMHDVYVGPKLIWFGAVPEPPAELKASCTSDAFNEHRSRYGPLRISVPLSAILASKPTAYSLGTRSYKLEQSQTVLLTSGEEGLYFPERSRPSSVSLSSAANPTPFTCSADTKQTTAATQPQPAHIWRCYRPSGAWYTEWDHPEFAVDASVLRLSKADGVQIDFVEHTDGICVANQAVLQPGFACYCSADAAALALVATLTDQRLSVLMSLASPAAHTRLLQAKQTAIVQLRDFLCQTCGLPTVAVDILMSHLPTVFPRRKRTWLMDIMSRPSAE